MSTPLRSEHQDVVIAGPVAVELVASLRLARDVLRWFPEQAWSSLEGPNLEEVRSRIDRALVLQDEVAEVLRS